MTRLFSFIEKLKTYSGDNLGVSPFTCTTYIIKFKFSEGRIRLSYIYIHNMGGWSTAAFPAWAGNPGSSLAPPHSQKFCSRRNFRVHEIPLTYWLFHQNRRRLLGGVKNTGEFIQAKGSTGWLTIRLGRIIQRHKMCVKS